MVGAGVTGAGAFTAGFRRFAGADTAGDEVADGTYHLKAEIPDVDPDKDITITVRDGVLTITAERSEKKESNGRSEFSYGTFVRSVTLPAGADDDNSKQPMTGGYSTSRCR